VVQDETRERLDGPAHGPFPRGASRDPPLASTTRTPSPRRFTLMLAWTISPANRFRETAEPRPALGDDKDPAGPSGDQALPDLPGRFFVWPVRAAGSDDTDRRGTTAWTSHYGTLRGGSGPIGPGPRIPARPRSFDPPSAAKCWRDGTRCSCCGSPARSCCGSPSGGWPGCC
jgi:hypothetical protein